MIKKYQKRLSRKKYQSKHYKNTLKNLLEMGRQKKEQNQQLLPSNNHTNR